MEAAEGRRGAGREEEEVEETHTEIKNQFPTGPFLPLTRH